jgi:ribonuclease VapC
MFVDTSAIVALILGEPEAGMLAATLERAETRRTSPLVRLETCAVLATRLDISPAQAEGLFEDLLAEADIVSEPITDAVGKIAVECFGAFGKGRHPAGLNIVDCFSYACARARGEALLFKGNDFARTDVNEAGPAGPLA